MSRKRKKKASPNKFQDGVSVSRSGAGTSCDYSTGQYPVGSYGYPPGLRPGSEQHLTSTPLFDGPLADNYFASMYRAHWEAKKIVDIIADDMTREGWRWDAANLDSEELSAISAEEERLGIEGELNLALKYERLYGGGVVFMGISGDEDDAESPVDTGTIRKGDLRFARAIPRHRIAVARPEVNPLSENYQRPLIYLINGQRVHRSRLLIFSSQRMDFPGFQNRRGDGFGDSVLAGLYQDVNYAQGARQGVRHLVEKASIAYVRINEILNMAGTVGGNAKLDRLEEIIQQMSIYRGVILGKDDSLENFSATFTGAAEVMMQFLQVLSAASDIPATRFLGEAPGGLNTDGDSSLQNYLGSTIPAKQKNNLLPQLVNLGPILAKSVLGKDVDGIRPKFNPLWTPPETEQSENEEREEKGVSLLMDYDLLDTESAVKILRARNRKFEALDDEDIDRIIKNSDGLVDDGNLEYGEA